MTGQPWLQPWDLRGAHSEPALLILIIMAAAQRRRDAMGMALAQASYTGNVLDMCRLINQGADVDYVFKFMHEGAEDSVTPLTRAAFEGHADAVTHSL
jgi:hypothetical protein